MHAYNWTGHGQPGARLMRWMALALALTVMLTGWLVGCDADGGPQAEVLFTQSLGHASLDVSCDAVTCQGHGTCDMTRGVPVCVCEPAYAGADCGECAAGAVRDDSGDCVIETACQTDTCVRGTCRDVGGVAVCQCLRGWDGTRCDSVCTGIFQAR